MATCAHEPCTCEVHREADRCSITCKAATPADPCVCGHRECAATVNPAVAIYGDNSAYPNEDDLREAHEAAPDEHV